MADSFSFSPDGASINSISMVDMHKAGIFIVGDVKQPDGSTQLHVIAPWVEGAYSSDGKKAYTLAKGSVDYKRHESLWETAVDETAQETGIDVRRIFNPYNPQHKAGSADFYNDVKIESMLQMPAFAGALPSNRGFEKNHLMYVVKVDNIEALAEHLKHKDNNPDFHAESVGKTAEQVGQEKGFYSFEQLLPVLRTGVWKLDKKKLGLDKPVKIFDELFYTNKASKTAFTVIEKRYAAKTGAKVPVETPDELDAMYKAVDSTDQRLIKDCLKYLREFMVSHDLVNDDAGLKLGDKHMPLRYYQEGADILPMDEWISRMVRFADEHELYKDTQFNPDIIKLENRDGKEVEKAIPALSMARMALLVADSLDKARIQRVEYIEDNPEHMPPKETWPSTVIEADSALPEQIERLEADVREKYGDSRCVA